MIPLWLLACAAPAERPLLVLAAASLTDVYSELEAAFEAANPGVDVTISFAGSQALATQLRHGLDADVFTSADARHVDALHAEGLVDAPRELAQNALVLAVSAGVTGAIDLAALPSLERLVVGGDEVPVGRYTRALLDAATARYGDDWRARVEARVVSREPNVRLVVTKVAMGEADAAVVYATDVAAVDGVRAVPVPADLAPVASYHHARVRGSLDPELADAWMGFVESAAGREVLARHGFRVSP